MTQMKRDWIGCLSLKRTQSWCLSTQVVFFRTGLTKNHNGLTGKYFLFYWSCSLEPREIEEISHSTFDPSGQVVFKFNVHLVQSWTVLDLVYCLCDNRLITVFQVTDLGAINMLSPADKWITHSCKENKMCWTNTMPPAGI